MTESLIPTFEISDDVSIETKKNEQNNNHNLLQLSLMVKNGATVIEATLKSYLPYISYWTIYDTGSTDGTQAIMKRVMSSSNIPGKLYEEPWIDFTPSRNRCLDLSGTRCVFTIMPDDSYILRGGDQLMKLLAKQVEKLDVKLISIHVQDFESNNPNDNTKIKDKVRYPRKLISRSKCNLRYSGIIHEAIEMKEDRYDDHWIKDDEIYLYDVVDQVTAERSRRRYRENDLPKLEQAVIDDPEDGHNWFYLGRTLMGLEENKKAIIAFQKRLEIDDKNYESHFECCVNLGHLHKNDSNLTDIVKWYLMATNFTPYRAAEPLYYIAKTYDDFANKCRKKIVEEAKQTGITNLEQNSFEKTSFEKKHFTELLKYYEEMYYLFLKQSVQYPLPSHALLFIDSNVYNYHRLIDCGIEALRRDDFETAQKAIEQVYKNRPQDVQVQDLYRIVTIQRQALMSQDRQVSNRVTNESQKKIIIFVTGAYYHSWNGNTPNLGGSEVMLVNQAESMAKMNYDVYAFVDCNVQDAITVNNVHYRLNTEFGQFVANMDVEHCIISRHCEYLSFVRRSNVKNVYLWCHDVLPFGIPVCDPRNFRKFIALCPWQEMILQSELSIPPHLISVVNNSIDIQRFQDRKKIRKIPMSFIYSSSADRDLENVLTIFPEIRKVFPKAQLNIYTDLERSFGHQPAFLQKMRSTLQMLTEYVHLHDRVNQKTLALKMMESEYWLYPNRVFPETYCITALEAQAAGCICICSNLAALNTTVSKERGICLDIKECNGETIVRKLEELEANIMLKAKYIQSGLKYAEAHDVDQMGREFYKLLQGHELKS